jgi:hypothetical protein
VFFTSLLNEIADIRAQGLNCLSRRASTPLNDAIAMCAMLRR